MIRSASPSRSLALLRRSGLRWERMFLDNVRQRLEPDGQNAEKPLRDNQQLLHRMRSFIFAPDDVLYS